MPTQQAAQVLAASRMANVRYAIRDLAVVADEVAREGHQILYLNIGDPCKFDFPTPPHMIEAVHKAMRDGHNSYGESLGIKPAVDAIRHQAEANGFRDIQSIFIGYGSGEVIDSCLTALLNPGDNVLTPSPEYPLYGAVLAKLDAVPNAYDLDESNGWEPDLADLERKVNPRTRAILLINPSNPTGAVMSPRTLERVLELARGHNLLILADEIYDKLIFDPQEKHISIATLAQDVPIITFNGLVEGVPRSWMAHRLGDCHGSARGAASLSGSRASPAARAPVGAASLSTCHQTRSRRPAGPHPRDARKASPPCADYRRLGQAHAARRSGCAQGSVLRASVARYSRG